MPRMGQGWPEANPIGTGENPRSKPSNDRKVRQRTMREMYAGRRSSLLYQAGVNNMSVADRAKLRGWIEDFMRNDWGKNK